MSEVKNVPELRFSEFLDAWSLLKVSDVARVYDGTHQTPKYVEQGVPFYSVEHVTANQFSETKYISEEVYEKENQRVRLEKSDILMTRIGSIGKAKYIDWDVRASFYVSLALFKVFDSFDSKFLSQLISSPDFQRELWKRTIHVAFPQKINLGEISHCKIVMPGLKEQQKIADFLSSVDKKIEQLTEKYRLLTQYKKGVMQQIFTQQIRFKDDNGNDYPEWEEKALGQLGEFVRGLSYDSSNVKSSGLLVLRSSNIQKGKLNFYEDTQFVDKNCPENIALLKGDIAVCMANGSKALVGKAGLYDGSYTGELTVGAFCSIYRSKSVLARLLFDHQNYKRALHVLLAGTNINNLKNSDLSKIRFKIPSRDEEQQKVAKFLTEIDHKIDQAWSTLEQTKAFKKGLLQKMFV
ncbi:restriction endonuclease subunit S [Thiomicrospira pelophila]|uniref:restriction endonuclease subunit S n=1 Tax=Thiomicrospira pelophila TaxID=934 RepID=UPI00069094B6|nr:restriction endonuclease subunit S [Thiomicrospira pelophila]